MSYKEFQTDLDKEMGLISTTEHLTAVTKIGSNKVVVRQVTHDSIKADTREHAGIRPLVDVSARVVTKDGVIIDIVALLTKPAVFRHDANGFRRPRATSNYSELIADIEAYYLSEQCRADFAKHEIEELDKHVIELEAEIALARKQKAKHESILNAEPPPCTHNRGKVYDPNIGEYGCAICGMPLDK